MSGEIKAICGRPAGDGSHHICLKEPGHKFYCEYGRIAEKELVNHPEHYGGEDNPLEHVKVATALGWHTDAFVYNCTKYLWRVGKKDGAPVLEDLRKAAWYLNERIKLEERGE